MVKRFVVRRLRLAREDVGLEDVLFFDVVDVVARTLREQLAQACGLAVGVDLPLGFQPYKLWAEVFFIGLLIVMNLRGLKEAIQILLPIFLGFVAGTLTVFLGIGGGFILVPAMIYLLGMPARIVIGTSLVMILAVTAGTTMVHAITTRAVDVVLAALLLVGGVIGAQYGAVLTTRLKPDLLRLALAVIILLVGLRMFLGLFWRPDEIFSIEYL